MEPQTVLNRKRIAEEFRKRRIFNPRLRQIGIDIEAINYQIHENRLAKAYEAERERKFVEEANRRSALEELREQQKKEESQKKEKEVDEYRKTQKPEYSQDYEINDPNWKKKTLPPRTSDAENCPVSSLQKFDGEDLEFEKRVKKQMAQINDMLLQQIEEKKMEKCKEEKEKQDWESIMMKLGSYAQQLESMAEKQARDTTTALLVENRDVARSKRDDLMSKKLEEEIEKKKDIEFNMNGDLLTENPEVARSIFGPNRVVPDRWKGMTKKQLQEIQDIQAKQIEENKLKKDKEEYEDRKWRELAVQQEKLAQKLDEEKKQKEKEKIKKFNQENEQLIHEQRHQKKILNEIVNTNYMTDDFFAQFNTTSR